MSGCYGFVVYDFGFIWSKLGYAKVSGLLACWQGWFGRHRNGHVWIIVPHCLMWCLWRERNNRCFENTERSIPDLKLSFFRTVLDWPFALQNQSFSSIFDFLDSCNFCIWPLYTSCVLGCPFFIFYYIYIYIYCFFIYE